MTTFVLLAAVLTLAGVALIAVPLLKKQAGRSTHRRPGQPSVPLRCW